MLCSVKQVKMTEMANRLFDKILVKISDTNKVRFLRFRRRGRGRRESKKECSGKKTQNLDPQVFYLWNSTRTLPCIFTFLFLLLSLVIVNHNAIYSHRRYHNISFLSTLSLKTAIQFQLIYRSENRGI